MRSIIKRIIALTAASLCLLTPVFADETVYEGDKNFTYFEVLSKLEILPEFISEKNPDEAITRGEFSYLAAAGFGYPTANSDRYFTDVDYSKEYAGAVMSLYSAGIVKGGENASFYPENYLTMSDASAILTRILGYSAMSDKFGGYSSGYHITANKIGLFNGVAQGGQYLSVSDAVRLVFNALTSNRMENEGYSGNDMFEVLENSSALLEMYDLRYTSGIVEKNAMTSLDAVQGHKGSFVTIGGERYTDIDAVAQNLLGYHADVLYKTETDGTKSVFLAYASGKNNTVRFETEDIYEYDDESITYDADSKEKSVKISFNASVIYNGVSAPSINGLDFIPEYGDISLVDNNNDNEYDVVFVNSYDSRVVFAVTEDVIIDIDNGEIDLSKYDADKIKIYKNNRLVDLSEIKPYDVITVCKSKKEEAVQIYVSQEHIVGVLNELADEECVIGEETYPLSRSWINEKEAGTAKLPIIGEEVLAYRDFKGNIICFKEALFNGMAYGYVLGLEVDASGLDDTLLRVINHRGEVDDIVLKENVSINQSGSYTVTELMPYLKDGDSVKHQLIKYKKGSKNMLKEICFEETGEIYDEKRLVLADKYDSENKKAWRASGRCFERGNGKTNVALTADSVVFSVPKEAADKFKPEKYAVSNYSILTTDNDYAFAAYDRREAGVANVILLEEGKAASFNTKATVSVISEVTTAVNEDGEEVLAISYMLAGSMKKAYTDAEITYGPKSRSATGGDMFKGEVDVPAISLKNPDTGIGEGDVVIIDLTSEGTIGGIYKFVDASKAPDMMDGLKNPTADGRYDAEKVTYGKMVGLNSTIYSILPEGATGENMVIPFSSHHQSTRYVYVDLNAKDITPKKVTVDYLNRCNNNDEYRVAVRTVSAAVLDCVIYKLKK